MAANSAAGLSGAALASAGTLLIMPLSLACLQFLILQFRLLSDRFSSATIYHTAILLLHIFTSAHSPPCPSSSTRLSLVRQIFSFDLTTGLYLQFPISYYAIACANRN